MDAVELVEVEHHCLAGFVQAAAREGQQRAGNAGLPPVALVVEERTCLEFQLEAELVPGVAAWRGGYVRYSAVLASISCAVVYERWAGVLYSALFV